MEERNLRIERKRRRKKENNLSILRAAEAVFAQKGYNSATMDDIARRAQFSKATLYRYFTSKGQIFYEIILNSFEDVGQKITKIQREDSSSVNKLREIIQYILQYFQQKKNISRISLMEKAWMQKIVVSLHNGEQKSSGEELVFLDSIRAKKREISRILCEVFSEGMKKGEFRVLSEEDACDVLESLIHGFYFTSFWHGKKHSLRKSTDLLYNFFLHGIEKKKNA